MHAVKRAAHRAARIGPKNDKNESYMTRYIPFRRTSSSLGHGPSPMFVQHPEPAGNTDRPRDLPQDVQSALGPDGRQMPSVAEASSPTHSEELSPTNKGSDRTDWSTATDVNQSKEGGSAGDIEKEPERITRQGTAAEYYNSPVQTNDPESQAAKARPRKRDRLTRMFKKEDKENGLDRTTSSASESKKKKHYGFWPQVKVVVFGNYINVLLVCVPIGIAFGNIPSISPYASFAINFLAIVPLAGILSYATEEIAERVGETLGGLLNASFGNAVELIVAIIALAKGEILIVQTSLIGSILSNLLLVMGMCFFFGGLKRIEQFFNSTVAQTSASLLALAIGSIIIPTTFLRWGTGGTYAQRLDAIPELSRGISIILLVVYACYLTFQLRTHSTMFAETGADATTRKKSAADQGSMRAAIGSMGANQAAHAGGPVNQEIFKPDGKPPEEEKDELQLSFAGALITLIASTVLVGLNSYWLVEGIGPLAQVISPEFIGLILLPIVGNAAEHATAVTVAIKDKMDLAIGVAVGSSLQIALLVLPLSVILGWIIGPQDGGVGMTLNIDGFLLSIVFIAVLVVNYLIGDGRTHWMEGVMLMMLYVMIAVAAYLYPATAASVVG